jgi:hypothetical protein
MYAYVFTIAIDIIDWPGLGFHDAPGDNFMIFEFDDDRSLLNTTTLINISQSNRGISMPSQLL